MVAFAGYVSVRLTNKSGAKGAQPGDYDVNRRHRKRLSQHIHSAVAVIYILHCYIDYPAVLFNRNFVGICRSISYSSTFVPVNRRPLL